MASIKFKEFKQLFSNPRVNKKELVRKVKHNIDDFQELQIFISKYRTEIKAAKSLIDNALYGKNPLPKEFSNLNNDDFRHYTGSLEHELNWIVSCLLDFPNEINEFLKLRSLYEDNLFKGNYAEARAILEKIEREICVSSWGIENRFILDEYEFGTEENWNTRKLFLREGIEPLVQSFANIFSVRAEKSISFFQFNSEIEKWLHVQGILDNSEYYSFNEYLRFRGNFFSFTSYSEYAFFLYMEAGASIVDKYLLLTRVCSHLILNPDCKSLILDLLGFVYEVIDDPTIRNLLIYKKADTPLKVYPNDTKFIGIVDLYTRGEYSRVLNSLKAYFQKNSSGELQMLELYVKALCELNLPYQPIFCKSCILDDVGKALYEVLMKKKDTEDALIKLVNYSYLLSNTRHGIFIYNFVSIQLGWENQLNYKFLQSSNSTVFNPLMVESSSEDIEHFSSRLTPLADSISFQLISAEYDVCQLSDKEKNTIPEIKLDLYKGRALAKKGEISNAKDVYLELLKKEDLSIIAKFEICSELFKCYLSVEEYRKAIQLFVKINSENPHLTKQMASQKVLEGVIKGKFKNIGERSDLIELPIFFKINSNDRIRIKQSLELFLRSVDCSKPSEFLSRVHAYSRSNVLYFLKNVCSTEILQLSRTFESTFLVNEERITICKFLTEFDSENSDRYKGEIADLTQRNTISKVIGRIDERKIYVNESKLKWNIKKIQKQNVFQSESVSPLNEDSFNRYVKLQKYIKSNNEYRSINPVSFNEQGEIEVNHDIGNDLLLDQYDVVFYYPAFQIFSTFFSHIRDLFVYNKENGIDTYLSTKIRHGTLPNHLRSVFESFFLVTTQSNNAYVVNEHWREKLDLNKIDEDTVQGLLSAFSKRIDDYSRKIKDEYIQCKSENEDSNPLAEFDYSYSEQDRIEMYISKFHDVHDINEFIELSFHELWSRTEQILERIRIHFNGDYKDTYLGYLGDLEAGLLGACERDQVNELLSNIMTCRTEVQYKLNNISQWFRRSESSYEGQYEIRVLAQTSIEITKNIHPSYSFEIATQLESSTTVKGEYHEHFIDLLNNCLFNMIVHSHLSSNELEAKLAIQEKEGNLILIFRNKVQDPNEHHAKLEEIKHNWHQLDANIAQERGTGFPKVKKIIVSDLNRKFSQFNFEIIEDEIEISLTFELKDL
jgi:hypothetical protein